MLNPGETDREADVESGEKGEVGDGSHITKTDYLNEEPPSPTSTTPLLSPKNEDKPKEKTLSMWDLFQNKSILITSVVVLLASNALTVLEPTLPAHLNEVPFVSQIIF